MIYSIRIRSIREFDTILEIAKKKNININPDTIERSNNIDSLKEYDCLNLHILINQPYYLTSRARCVYNELSFYEFCEKLLEYDHNKVLEYESKIKKQINEFLNI